MLTILGRSLELNELVESDLVTLCNWRNSACYMQFCTSRRSALSLDEFKEEIFRDFSTDRHAQFIIRRRGIAIGTIFSHGLSRVDGHVFITTYIDEKYQTLGFGPEAFVLFFDYLVHTEDLFKVYTDVYSYNRNSLDGLLKVGFVEEGRFVGHRLFDGNRHDVIRLAFYTEKLLSVRKLIRWLTGTHASTII